jgi:hypothetical protein
VLEVVRYACSNWVVTPTALAVNEAPPNDIREQRFTLVLSGVGLIDFEGDPDEWPWTHRTLHIRPDFDPALAFAISHHAIPTPPGEPGNQYLRCFEVEQIAPHASVAAYEGPNDKVIGFACDAWRAHPYETMTDAFTSAPLPRLFAGIEADLALRFVQGRIHRVNYHVTLVGKIRFAAIIIS